MPWIEEPGMPLTGLRECAMLRVGEAAELLSVSRETIDRWAMERRLQGKRLGRLAASGFGEFGWVHGADRDRGIYGG